MDPVVVGGCDIAAGHFVLLAVDPVGQKQQHVALGIYDMVGQLPLVGREIFGVDVHADRQRTPHRLVLSGDEVEVFELTPLLCPKLIVVVKVAFSIVYNEISLTVDHSCRIKEAVL